MSQGIPKRIIQVWGAGEASMPLPEKASAASVKRLNPDYEYMFFDDRRIEACVQDRFPEYRDVFDSFRIPIQRYDFFRYLAVYYWGGFYFDVDVFLATGLDDLLSFDCVFPFEELTLYRFLRREYGMDWEVGNFGFGATAGNPFIGAVIENCVKAQKDPAWAQAMLGPIPRIFREDYRVFCTSGPGLVSRTLAEYPEAGRQVKVLFPENVCDPSQWGRFGDYGVHLKRNSWFERHGFLRRRSLAFWRSRTRAAGLKESTKIGPVRSLIFRRRR